MFYRPFNANMLWVLIIVGALTALSVLVLPVYNLAFAQEDGTIEYAENGTGPVATFTATDPDAGDSVTWSVTGTDAGDFSIDNGVLTFSPPPDFEVPADDGPDNVYEIMVVATDSATLTDMVSVTVMVTDVDEAGTVSLSSLNPQLGIPLTASVTDLDNVTDDSEEWQWARSEDMTAWTDIEDAEEPAYTPVAADAGNYLRATVEYKDGESTEKTKTAEAVSANPVMMTRTVNTAPAFPDTEDGDRDVAENTAAGMPVGSPVVAEDAEKDALTYSLTGDAADSFDINSATGQITVGAGTVLNFEGTETYSGMVTATDPFGVSDTKSVNVMVTDVNEAPTVSGDAAPDHDENDAGTVATYMVTDPDTGDADSVTWSVEGTDGDAFSIITGGVLSFGNAPNFEAPEDADGNNVYQITVVADDGKGGTDDHAVTVTVENVNELGMVNLSSVQPQVETELTATLTDPDGGMSGTTWKWETSSSSDFGGTVTAIEGATSSTYTPMDDDEGDYLRAMATYRDAATDADVPDLTVSSVPVEGNDVQAKRSPFYNTAPNFPTSETGQRMVDENTAPDMSVGNAVLAEDVDPEDTATQLTYSLGGVDAGTFGINQTTGQLTTKARLDFEMKASHTVIVTATDPSGASGTTTVTIMVGDVNEAPKATGPGEMEYAENGTGPVATFTATDPDAGDFVSWSVTGTDAGDFSIDNGVLTFSPPPDFEVPADDGPDNSYQVTVVATDSATLTDMVSVTVMVTDVDEAGTVSLSSLNPQLGIPLTASVTDLDNVTDDSEEWQWARSEDMTAWTDIEDAEEPAYTPVAADAGNYLRATVEYKDGESTEKTKTAEAVSANPVMMTRTVNTAPAFPDTEDGDRDVAENTAAGMPVGSPVVAEDAEKDALTYSLTGDAADSFDINSATGQITVGAGTVLNFEGTETYSGMVTATDPFGVSDTKSVNVMVTDVNEAPTVSGDAAPDHDENDAGTVATYMVTDPDTGDADSVTWSVEGTDGDAFSIITGGVLSFGNAPNFEAPEDADGNNVYQITVVADDGKGGTDDHAVTVTVENVNELGMVNLSSVQPQVETELTATLTDPDGGMSGTTWKWETSSSSDFGGTVTAIEGATSSTYTPMDDDEGDYLRAMATYRDAATDADVPDLTVSSVPVEGNDVQAKRSPFYNTAPNFPTSETGQRMVDENTAPDMSVGNAVLAEDVDPEDTATQLTYSLGGVDAGTFGINQTTGQLTTKARLDFEMKASHTVIVTATDPSGASGTTTVTIMVGDVNEAPKVMEGGLVITGPRSVTHAENGTAAVQTYTVAGPESASASWSPLSGDDASAFSLSNGGMLTFRSSPDYENPMDADMDNVYMVTIMADDGTYMDTHDVMVMVINVDEMGRVTFWRDGADATTAAIMVGDELGGAVDDSDGNPGDTFPIAMYTRIAGVNVTSWQWAKSMTPDMMDSWMDIGTGGMYTVMNDDAGHYLRATATYNDGEDTGKMKDATTMMVGGEAVDPLLAEYDPNGDGAIVRVDMLRAVGKFFADPPELTRAEMLRLVIIYFN